MIIIYDYYDYSYFNTLNLEFSSKMIMIRTASIYSISFILLTHQSSEIFVFTTLNNISCPYVYCDSLAFKLG